jgi:hypothetical protein
MNPMRGSEDDQLDQLLRAFRDACPTPEPGANFMPQLWQKIESRQRYAFSFQRMASALMTAALAATVALGVYMAMPKTPGYYSQSYAEVLTDGNTIDVADLMGVN